MAATRKKTFYEEIVTLVRESKGSDVLTVTGDFSAQVDGFVRVKLVCLDRGACSLRIQMTDTSFTSCLVRIYRTVCVQLSLDR